MRKTRSAIAPMSRPNRTLARSISFHAITGAPARQGLRSSPRRVAPSGPVQPSAPRARACSSSRTSAPPTRIGAGISARRNALIARCTCGSRSGVVAPSTTAKRRGVDCAISTNDSGGVSAPRSMTSKPTPRRRSASSAFGNAWSSPVTAPSTTAPRLRPGHANRGPSRPIRRCATPVARCSSAMVSSPTSQRDPIDARHGISNLRWMSAGVAPAVSVPSMTAQAPISSPATIRSSSRVRAAARDPRRGRGRSPPASRSVTASGATRHSAPSRTAGSLPVRT